MAQTSADDLLRIIIATDCHLGVWEDDEERRNDAYESFEEVFKIAQDTQADLVLLAGDLFHEPRPSHTTVVQAMKIFRKYCLGSKGVKFQILSDQKKNFEAKQVNFEDPSLKVQLPVFSIHGNHDDPQGYARLSAVDIVSECGFVNYFGKYFLLGADISTLELEPILLQKGQTKVALYGLGNLRDERLARSFQTHGCVTWKQPSERPGYQLDDWFNIFVLHQNRVQHSVSAKNTVLDSHLAQFLDFVVWGHEHECIPQFQRSSVGNFDVLQPGSTVATALSEGEAKLKHVFQLDIVKKERRIVKHALSTVRPFVYNQVVLKEHLDSSLEGNDQVVEQFLKKRVEKMVQMALSEYAARQTVSNGKSITPKKPLIRLKVDYTKFSVVSSQVFHNYFAGKVANAADILTWHKSSAKREAKTEDGAPVKDANPADLDNVQMEDLIGQYVQEMTLYTNDELSAALKNYVEKDQKGAVRQLLDEARRTTVQSALNDEELCNLQQQGMDSVSIGKILEKHSKVRQHNRVMSVQQKETADTEMTGNDDELDDQFLNPDQNLPSTTSLHSKQRNTKSKDPKEANLSNSKRTLREYFTSSAQSSQQHSTQTKRMKYQQSTQQEVIEDSDQDNAGINNKEDDMQMVTPDLQQLQQTQEVASTSRSRASGGRKGRGRGRGRGRRINIESDDDEEDQDDSSSLLGQQRQQQTSSGRKRVTRKSRK